MLEVGSANLVASFGTEWSETPSTFEESSGNLSEDGSWSKVEVSAVADLAGRNESEDRDLDIDHLNVGTISNLSSCLLYTSPSPRD